MMALQGYLPIYIAHNKADLFQFCLVSLFANYAVRKVDYARALNLRPAKEISIDR